MSWISPSTVNRLTAILWPVMMLVLNVSTVAILWFGAIRIDAGQMQFGALIAFIQYAALILFSFLMLSIMFIMLPRAAASATRINEVLRMKPEIRDAKSDAKHPLPVPARTGVRRLRGRDV